MLNMVATKVEKGTKHTRKTLQRKHCAEQDVWMLEGWTEPKNHLNCMIYTFI